jgi:general secretion pathway protein L
MNPTLEKSLANIRAIFEQWMDSVVHDIADVTDRLSPPRTVTLVEDENGELELRSGEQPLDQRPSAPHQIAEATLPTIQPDLTRALQDCRVNILLQPDRFLFRPLELPSRATEFLGGIVRSQIERLMPWNPANMAFGWSEPTEVGSGRMTVTVAATSVDAIKPILEWVTTTGARSIRICAAQSDAAAIPIWDEKIRGRSQNGRIRRVLVAVLAAAGISSVLAATGSTFIGMSLNAQQSELTQRLAQLRGAGQSISDRKWNAPSAVMTIEALSKLLPNDTYVTELHIDGNKLRLSGVTRDAPSLIGTMEKSGRFARATFFAPTTRSKNAGDQFHIEAIIVPTDWSRT